MSDRVRLSEINITPFAASALDRAGERLGVSTAAVVEMLSRHAGKIGERDVAKLPDGFRGRRGMGRRRKDG